MLRTSSLLLTAVLAAAPAFAQEADNLRVLLVGHDPAAPKVPFPDMANERTYALYRERTAAFEALLRYHFEGVRVVHADDYRVEMSDEVDVTVFDALPKPVTPAGAEDGYRPAVYLPESFDHPALMIAENSPRIGDSLGLKLDWL